MSKVGVWCSSELDGSHTTKCSRMHCKRDAEGEEEEEDGSPPLDSVDAVDPVDAVDAEGGFLALARTAKVPGPDNNNSTPDMAASDKRSSLSEAAAAAAAAAALGRDGSKGKHDLSVDSNTCK